jgi:hypothetical protein
MEGLWNEDGMPVFPAWLLEELHETDESMTSSTSTSSDEDQDSFGGSPVGRKPNKQRSRFAGNIRLFKDYFSENPTYNEGDFRRRFRMQKSLFLRIHDGILHAEPYFVQRPDACGVLGLSSFQKMTAALRMLAYGTSADLLDDALRMGESTILESLQYFCQSVIEIYGGTYLRAPTAEDMERILSTNASRGFPGMLGSLDCMHWHWKNCPKAWAGQYTGKENGPTIIAEAVATYDLWIWHLFFGMPGSNNDLNVLDRSPLFKNLMKGESPTANFMVNNNHYSMCYFLVDGIYPPWAPFVGTISHPQGKKRKHFSKMQESVRKDVERAFGVLQARFQILDRPCKLWSADAMEDVITACVILHNMIVEDERDNYRLNNDYLFGDAAAQSGIEVFPALPRPKTIEEIRATGRSLLSKDRHFQLQADLIEHLWAIHGDDDDDHID